MLDEMPPETEDSAGDWIREMLYRQLPVDKSPLFKGNPLSIVQLTLGVSTDPSQPCISLSSAQLVPLIPTMESCRSRKADIYEPEEALSPLHCIDEAGPFSLFVKPSQTLPTEESICLSYIITTLFEIVGSQYLKLRLLTQVFTFDQLVTQSTTEVQSAICISDRWFVGFKDVHKENYLGELLNKVARIGSPKSMQTAFEHVLLKQVVLDADREVPILAYNLRFNGDDSEQATNIINYCGPPQ
ncbi:unnamed protein product [Dicrocoelium dendriticum]|nr:unnamed protein product [Dicrocoelium dendriticum]